MRVAATLSLLFACGVESAECERVTGQSVVPDMVVAEWQGGAVTLAEVEEQLDRELRTMAIEYALRRHERMEAALDGLVDERLLSAEALSRGLGSVEELLVAQVEESLPEPDEAAIRALYPHIARQIPGITVEEARPRIVQDLQQRAVADHYRRYVDTLRLRAGVERDFPYPELPPVPVRIDASDPVLGPEDAPITIIAFTEYQCFYCSEMQPVLDAVRDRWPDDVRIVFKDFPLSGHGRALPAAVAAHCAGEQGRFWDYHRRMMADQGSVSELDLHDHAQALGLDPAAFAGCRGSGRHEPGIFSDLAIGREAGVRATPTFFVDGTLLAGRQPLERFEDVVGRALDARR
ncbi:MAG: protein-disulfide isomerase [Myxococcota bacterium]